MLELYIEDVNRILKAEPRLEQEEHPPRIARAQAFPYPDLKRLWVRVDMTPFVKYPNLELNVFGPDGELAQEMFVIENRDLSLSLTMHLPDPVPDAPYRLQVVLIRDEEVLDTAEVPFHLTFVDIERA
ncbi:MAG TPA: hypothetical protein EYP04_04405 [Anaerolineae bacterium]|nr:hypothetical protein [Anaerolineae bacterium]HIQ05431.1 hypothetical protein [Anaerolineae bacterium]